MWNVLPERRRYAAEAVAVHLRPSAEEAERIARESFRNTGRSFLELFLTGRVDQHFVHERLDIENTDTYKAIVQDTGPAVVVSAHLGAWELLASVGRMVFPRPRIQLIVRTIKDDAMNREVTRLRGRPSIDVIENTKASLRVLRELKRGGFSGFLVDHNCMRNSAVFIPFMGRHAAVNKGPAILSLRARATLWPCFLIRKENGRYGFFIDEPLETANMQGDDRERIAAVSRFYTRAVEKYVRMFPEQWLWIHKRWKTRPEPGDFILDP